MLAWCCYSWRPGNGVPGPTRPSRPQHRNGWALDGFTPVKTAGAGVLLSAATPKNLVFIIGGAAAVAQTGLPAGEQAIAWAVLTLIATIGVGAPWSSTSR